MDNRLVLTLLFVTLSWMSAGATNVTTAANTTSATNVTTAANTTSATNVTTAANTTSATNVTTAANATSATNVTAAANATSATNVTTAANATSATNVTTAAANATSATNVTTAAANTTSATNVTTAAGNNTTLMTNTTVETLGTPVSRAECGSQKLCGAQPTDCDPSTANSCFFASFKQMGNSRNFEIEVSGESDGYVACTLSRDSTLGGNDTTYVCANNNGTVQFFGALLNNNQLTKTTLNVNSVKGNVNGRKIQCTFAATAPSPLTTRVGDSFAIGIGTGPFNSTAGTLGSPTPQFLSGVVVLSNPNATATNTLNANTTSPNATSHGITLRQSLTQAVLMTVGVLSLATL